MPSTPIVPTKAASCADGEPRPETPEAVAPPRRLSPKAVALGALAGAMAAFVFAPDLSSVVAGDDPGIHSFFVNESARKRSAPASFGRPAASRAGVWETQSHARAATPGRARAYAPLDFREPALDAIHAATLDPSGRARSKTAKRNATRQASAVKPLTISAIWSAPSTPASFEPMGRRAVCVRLCDGYHFPLGAVRGAGDARAQAGMCQSLCPGAPARVYVMPAGSERIEEATSLDGRRYDRLPVAFRHASTRDNACSCRPAEAAADSPLMSLLDDLTMRRGDAVMTAKGVRVFRGATRWPLRQRDFVRVGKTDLSPQARAALATLDRLNARTQRAREAARQAAAAKLSPRTL